MGFVNADMAMKSPCLVMPASVASWNKTIWDEESIKDQNLDTDCVNCYWYPPKSLTSSLDPSRIRVNKALYAPPPIPQVDVIAHTSAAQ